MLQMIQAIFASPIWPSLALKGGTACYFLYGLERFSTDLDFDIIQENAKVDEILKQVLTKFGKNDGKQKITLSYRADETKIKIDISRKIWKANEYEEVSFFGKPIRLQTKATIFANKLVALLERMANRDLYDVYFFFQHLRDVNESVILERTGKSSKEVCGLILEQLQRLPKNYKILDGLGEALYDNKQKAWVKTHLLEALKSMLLLQISDLK